jgi:hypothetical protein
MASLLWVEFASARSLIHDVERNLKTVKRELCAVAPSSKCKTPRKKIPASKMPTKKKAPDTKANTPAAPSPVVVPKPQLKPADLKPAEPPPLPKLKPKDLKVETPPAKAPPPVPQPKPAAPAVVTPPVTPQPVPPPVVTAPSPPPPAANTAPCLQALATTGAVFSPVPQPGTTPECAVDNPVRLNALKTSLGMIKLRDQPTVNCAYALKLQDFVANSVQPLAQSEMGSPIVAMGTGPGFDCRGRNGDSSAKISEHAKGNAVDIVFFNFANKVGVLVKDALDNQAPGFAFLRDVRAEACKNFTTVLGPGANTAHAEHFHIDLEERKGGYRICE